MKTLTHRVSSGRELEIKFLILTPSSYIFLSTSLVFPELIFPTEELTCSNRGLSTDRNMALNSACPFVFERKHPFLHGREFPSVLQKNDFPSKRRTGRWRSTESGSARTTGCENRLIQVVGGQRIALSKP